MTKQTIIIIIVLLVLLIASISYIGYIEYKSYKLNKQQQQINIAQAGAQLGYQQAIIDVATLASTCQSVPLVIGNQTINMVAVECLQQQVQQQAQ